MQRKILAILISISFIICFFAGCGTQTESPSIATAEAAESTTEQIKDDQSGLLNVEFTSKDVQAMSNYINGEYYVSNGVWTAFGVNKLKKRIGLSTSKSGSEEGIILEKYCSNINMINEWIYCLARSGGSSKYALIRIRISGSGEKTIVEPKENYTISDLIIRDSKAYYLELPLDESAGSALYSCDLDGKNKKTILDKDITDYYLIGDSVLYIDYETGHLLVCSLAGENERLLVNEWVNAFIYDGTSLFYSSYKEKITRTEYNDLAEDTKGVIKYVSPNNTNGKIVVSDVSVRSAFAIDDDYIYYGNSSDSSRLYRATKDGKRIMLVSKDTYIERILTYSDSIIYSDEKKEKDDYYIERMILSDKSGNNKVALVSDN